MDFNHLLFSSQGRISRKPYWIGLLAIVMASIVLTIALGQLFGIPLNAVIAEHPPTEAKRLNLLVDMILFWPGFALTVKRLHDRDKGALLVVLLYALYAVVTLLDLFGLAGMGANPQPTTIFVVASIPFLVLGFWLFAELGFWRGTNGNNKYGPDPLGAGQTALGGES